jgi:c-di-GMP-binding flagellar brake protein YcgR
VRLPEGGVEAPARVTDLSFSGAGLLVEASALAGLHVDQNVHVRLEGDDLGDGAELTGLIRRCAIRPAPRGRTETALGVEFLELGPRDRQGTQRIRQYVMAQQRRLLATRHAS